MTTSPIFLTVEAVCQLHDLGLERYGGLNGIRDMGLLESAVAQARASFGGEFLHKDLFEMAAAYAFHIAQNQPFIDGNKRAALAAALVFLDLNGAAIEQPTDILYEAMIGLAEHKLDKPGLAKILRSLAVNSDSSE
jgi:death on curing protein